MVNGTLQDENNNNHNQKDVAKKCILAPMVRGSELAFRTLIRKYGVSHCYSPMLRAREVIHAYNEWKLQGKDDVGVDHLHEDGVLFFQDILKDKEPLTVQLCGCCPDTLYSATAILLELPLSNTITGVDLNLGCPQSCAMDGCFGAFLVERNTALAIKCVSAMKRAIDDSSFRNPNYRKRMPSLSCKMRLLDSIEDTIEVAKRLQAAGCEILAVHCRQRVEKHEGVPDLEAGKQLVHALTIPVWINGSLVKNVSDIQRVLEYTKADGVMVAREFLENPSMLQPQNQPPAVLAAEYLDCAELYPPPSHLYIQKHLRWIFRRYLEPLSDDLERFPYIDWKARLWTFLVRPYITTLDQFRQVVALYAKLSSSALPQSLNAYRHATFHSIRHRRFVRGEGGLDGEMDCPVELLSNLFQ